MTSIDVCFTSAAYQEKQNQMKIKIKLISREESSSECKIVPCLMSSTLSLESRGSKLIVILKSKLKRDHKRMKSRRRTNGRLSSKSYRDEESKTFKSDDQKLKSV